MPTTANPGPMVLLVSDGKGAASSDRAIIRTAYTTKVETIKEMTDIQNGSSLLNGEPQVSSILHLNTDQSGGLPGQTSEC